jgi:hypothetical protein
MLITARSAGGGSRLAGNPAVRRLGRRVLVRRDEAGAYATSAAPDGATRGRTKRENYRLEDQRM